MPTQPISNQALRPPTARYEQLLQERVIIGVLYVDALSHGSVMDDAVRLFTRARQLDRALGRFRRYGHDEVRIVMAAEDDRWHVPGQPPATLPTCRLCIKAALSLPLQIVLPMASTDPGGQVGRAA
jgi:hypothetical protein